MNNVAIIMPAYNACVTLDQSIEAIYNQSHESWVLWVLIDGGNERDAEIAKSWSQKDARIVTVISSKHRGVVRMRNIGLRLSRGDWYAFCDADDFWIPAKLALQLEFAIGNNVDLVYSNFYFYYPKTFEKRWVGTRLTTTGRDLLAVNSIPMSTSLVKRLPAMHYFEMLPGDQIHEDYVYWLTLLFKHPHLKAKGIGTATVYISQMANSRSGNAARSIGSHWYVLKAHTTLGIMARGFYMLQYLVGAALKRMGAPKQACVLREELKCG